MFYRSVQKKVLTLATFFRTPLKAHKRIGHRSLRIAPPKSRNKGATLLRSCFFVFDSQDAGTLYGKQNARCYVFLSYI